MHYTLAVRSCLLLVLLSLYTAISSHAQHRCATEEVNAKRSGILPAGKTAPTFEAWLRTYRHVPTNRRIASGETAPLTVPVVVHIVNFGEEIGVETNLSAEQVCSQFKVLNRDYNRLNEDTANTPALFRSVVGEAGVLFRPALFGPDGERLEEPGIHRYFSERRVWSVSDVENELMPATLWNPRQYLNIWVVNLLGRNIGFGYYPVADVPGLVPNLEYSTDQIDGVVIDFRHFGSNFTGDGTFDLAAQYNRGRTTTHEVGHWLGLRHTWGDNLFDCAIDDFCDDTPASRATNEGIGLGTNCSSDVNSCPADSRPDMFQNFMTYADDACMNLFTLCQATRMRTVIQLADRRRQMVENTPTVPSNVLLNYTDEGAMLLWEPSQGDSDTLLYLVERADAPGSDFVPLAVTPATTYTDEAARNRPPTAAWQYRVVAVTPRHFSAPSAIAALGEITQLPRPASRPSLQLFPNPSSGVLHVQLEGQTAGECEITLWNVQGKLLYRQSWATNSPLVLDLGAYPDGLYLLRLTHAGGSMQQKFVKQRR